MVTMQVPVRAAQASDDAGPAARPAAVEDSNRVVRGGGPRGQTMLRLTRLAAALITVVIGVASFALSFASLYDLARRCEMYSSFAWLWPVTVDGTIVLATMAIVALAEYPDQRSNRRFFWVMLGAAALVSVGGNALHALLPRDVPLNPWLAAAIATVAPLSLLADTHGLAVLWRFRPTQPAEAAAALTAQRVNKWEAVASQLVERGKTKLPVVKVAEILRSVHDLGISHRQVGLEHNVDKGTVGALKAASLEVLQPVQEAPVTAGPT